MLTSPLIILCIKSTFFGTSGRKLSLVSSTSVRIPSVLDARLGWIINGLFSTANEPWIGRSAISIATFLDGRRTRLRYRPLRISSVKNISRNPRIEILPADFASHFYSVMYLPNRIDLLVRHHMASSILEPSLWNVFFFFL